MVRRSWLLLLALTVAAQEPPPVFRTTTKLVEVSVVAQDKQGKPIADLRREEFQVFDNGAPQEIRLFVAEKPVAVAAETLPANTFSNQPSGGRGERSGYAVILFDNLVSGFGDPDEDGTGFGVQKALKVIRSMPEGEKIALYALGRKLQVVREFTADRESLEQRLRTWKPSVDDAVTGTALCLGKPDVVADCIRNDALQRLPSLDGELMQIADHLEGVPGRKNLIWMANRFPVVMSPGVRKLMNAGVSIYPVDDAGVCRLCPPPPVDQMRALAALTGGVAYLLRNDLDVAALAAIEDGRISYTLGFYQPGEDKQARLHQLGVRVSRPGVSLRYRTGYLTEPPRPVSANPVADLVTAMNRPMDATAIPLRATATRVQDELDLALSIDVSSLDLKLDQGLWKGDVEVVARFMAADGAPAGEAVAESLRLNLRQTTYDSMQQSGVPYRKKLKVPAKAVELKFVVGSLAIGKIGTLTVPLSK
jgi:VWFA-related protein